MIGFGFYLRSKFVSLLRIVGITFVDGEANAIQDDEGNDLGF